MRTTLLIHGIAFALLIPCLFGCTTEPEQMVVGKWAGDSSAMGVGMKAAKLKSDNPDISAKDARDAARAMASFGLVLKADKTCELLAGGNKLSGTYTFDKAENLVEMDFTTADIAPQNEAQNAEPFKPQQWVGMFTPAESKLELMMGGRDVYNMVKEIRKTQPLPGLIVLKKA